MQHGGKLQESHTAGTLTHPCMVSSQCQGGNEACGRDDVLGRAGTLDISWPETLSLLAQRDPRSLLVWSRGCVPQALHLQSGGGSDPRRPCRRRSPWRARGGRRTCPWAATRSWPWELLLALWGCAKCLCYTICVPYVVVTPVWGSELSKPLSCLMVLVAKGECSFITAMKWVPDLYMARSTSDHLPNEHAVACPRDARGRIFKIR